MRDSISARNGGKSSSVSPPYSSIASLSSASDMRYGSSTSDIRLVSSQSARAWYSNVSGGRSMLRLDRGEMPSDLPERFCALMQCSQYLAALFVPKCHGKCLVQVITG